MMILKQADQFAYRMAMPWYHVSPYELPDGTRLTPSGGKTLYDDMYGVPANADRRNHVWVTDSPDHAIEWSNVIAEDTGTRPKYTYEVEPGSTPKVYDQEYPDDEWTTDSALVKRRVW